MNPSVEFSSGWEGALLTLSLKLLSQDLKLPLPVISYSKLVLGRFSTRCYLNLTLISLIISTLFHFQNYILNIFPKGNHVTYFVNDWLFEILNIVRVRLKSSSSIPSTPWHPQILVAMQSCRHTYNCAVHYIYVSYNYCWSREVVRHKTRVELTHWHIHTFIRRYSHSNRIYCSTSLASRWW